MRDLEADITKVLDILNANSKTDDEDDEYEAELDIQYAFRLLYSTSASQRQFGIAYLEQVDSKMTLLAARAGVSDGSPAVREFAIETLIEFAKKQDAPRFIAALSDKAWEVRASAADGLGVVRSAAAAKALIARYAQEPNNVVRRDIALALALYGTAYVKDLQEFLDAEEAPIAQVGLRFALYLIDPATDICEILKFLAHRDHLVRHNAVSFMIADRMRASDVDFVIKSLMEHLEREQHPECHSDTELNISELKIVHSR